MMDADLTLRDIREQAVIDVARVLVAEWNTYSGVERTVVERALGGAIADLDRLERPDPWALLADIVRWGEDGNDGRDWDVYLDETVRPALAWREANPDD